MTETRERGRVQFWKGTYGFLAVSGGGPDLFVSYRGIEGDGFRALEEGQSVTFTRGTDPQGRPCAIAVRVEAS